MSAYHQFRSFIGQRYREAALYPRISLVETKPKAMFFPSNLREGASRLRAYNISDALQALGWSTIVVPKQLELGQRGRLIKRYDPDILFFQQCRHDFNDSLCSFEKPFVLDMDDADFFDPSLRDKIERTCAAAEGVIAGSRFIAGWCSKHNPNTTIVWTGTPVTEDERPNHLDRPPIIAWAQRSPFRYPRELEFVRSFYAALKSTGATFALRLYGINTLEERGKVMELFGGDANLEMRPLLDYEEFIKSLYDVSIGLSPIIVQSEFSRGKSFGKILGYLDAKVPVIVSEEADHALFFTPESGFVSNSLEVWVRSAVRLLEDSHLRNAMADRAFRHFQIRLTTEAAASKVDVFLRSIVQPRADAAPTQAVRSA